MSDSGEALVEARVKRFEIARLRVGQMLVPVAAVTSIWARREPTVLSAVVAFGLLGVVLFAFLSASKRFGWQALHFEGDTLTIGKTGIQLQRFQIRSWTLVNDVARLYAAEQSFELRLRDGSQMVVSTLLQSVFGQRVTLERRGSSRAIVLSLAAGVFGTVLTAFAIAREDLRLLIGLPIMFAGLIAAGVLSQRIAR